MDLLFWLGQAQLVRRQIDAEIAELRRLERRWSDLEGELRGAIEENHPSARSKVD
jgi:transposase